MARRNEEIDYEASLEERFKRWDEVHENGCSDPFWADGVNLNLIRNHIICYKNGIKNEHPDGDYPEVYYRETPPKMSYDYIAKPERIRREAKKTLELFDKDENLKFIKEKRFGLDEKFMQRNSVTNVLGYEQSLKTAIDRDDLIMMRRMGNADTYLESFKNCALKIAEYRNQENTQISMFDVV